MNQTKTQPTIVKLNKSHNADLHELSALIVELAILTENKVLDPKTTYKSVEFILSNPNYGFFCVSPIDSNDLTKGVKGMHLITFAFDIHINKFSIECWLLIIIL